MNRPSDIPTTLPSLHHFYHFELEPEEKETFLTTYNTIINRLHDPQWKPIITTIINHQIQTLQNPNTTPTPNLEQALHPHQHVIQSDPEQLTQRLMSLQQTINDKIDQETITLEEAGASDKDLQESTILIHQDAIQLLTELLTPTTA